MESSRQTGYPPILSKRPMAIIYPNNPVGALPPETVKVFRLLKRLPDESYSVWQRLTIDAEAGPDFWVRHGSGRSLLIKVSQATAQQARNARQTTLFASDGHGFGMSEQVAPQQFLDALDAADSPLGTAQVPLAVVFPNVPGADLQLALPEEWSGTLHWASRDELAPDRLEGWIESRLGEALSPA